MVYCVIPVMLGVGPVVHGAEGPVLRVGLVVLRVARAVAGVAHVVAGHGRGGDGSGVVVDLVVDHGRGSGSWSGMVDLVHLVDDGSRVGDVVLLPVVGDVAPRAVVLLVDGVGVLLLR